jgi:hypothetical protein
MTDHRSSYRCASKEDAMTSIRIKAGPLVVEAELNDSPTAQAIAAALPIKGKANCWGDEIYFRIPVSKEAMADARAEMAVGELAYWPPGQAFCIFFGPTPASSDERPQAASPANPLGRILGDASKFREVASGAEVILEKA